MPTELQTTTRIAPVPVRTVRTPGGVPQVTAADYRAWMAAEGSGTGQDPMELFDASNECEHEALPHDRNKPPQCHCWDALTSTPDLMGQLAELERQVRKRAKRTRTAS